MLREKPDLQSLMEGLEHLNLMYLKLNLVGQGTSKSNNYFIINIIFEKCEIILKIVITS